MLDLDAIARIPVGVYPFPHMVARNVLDQSSVALINRDFPDIRKPGIFPLSELTFGPTFAQLIEEIESDGLEELLSEKYQLDLSRLPLMVTVRGFCRARDGKIHVDSTDKVVTCLLYLNPGKWDAQGGRLRLLRDGQDLDNVIAEVPPEGGTFVSFRRTEFSWHGHASYEGPRRYVMFNWMTSAASLNRNEGRHRLSAWVKQLFDAGY